MNKNVRLLGVASAVRLLGAAMVYPFLSLYLKNVAGLGYAEIGALLVLVAVLPLAVTPFGGLITDRAGRRRVFIAGLTGEAASVFLIAVSMRFELVAGILFGGAMAGVAGSIAQPAIQAYVADLTDVKDRTMAYTWVRIGFNVGFTLGVAAGGVLIGFIGYPETALVTTGILVGGVVFILIMLDPSPYDAARSRGASLAEAPRPASRPGSFRASLRILAADRTFLVLYFASVFSGLIYGNWGTTFVLYSNTILFVPTGILGLALALNGVIVIFGQMPTTKLMTGRKHTYSAVLAVVLMGASFVALGGISLVAGGALVAVFTFVVLLTIGENLGAIPSMTLASNVAPATEIGNYNGVFGMFNGIGGSISPLLGGLVLAYVASPLAEWLILAIPCVPAILLFQWVGRRIPLAANTV
ncbi:MAG: MFS transporter [Nitrososphaerota archaeon]|nr:MFS transporter [Nitrososphaerota archaeon]